MLRFEKLNCHFQSSKRIHQNLDLYDLFYYVLNQKYFDQLINFKFYFEHSFLFQWVYFFEDLN